MRTFRQEDYRFRLYDNSKKKTWQEIRKETGCEAIINTAYFSLSSYKVESHTMVGGKWLMEPKYHEYGLCIDQAGALTLGYEAEAVWDYTVGVSPLYIGGEKYYAYREQARNGVSFVGIRSGGAVTLLLSGADNGLTSREACDILLKDGCKDILRYDGSWSSQGTLGTGMDVDPSQERKARIYLLVYKREEESIVDQNGFIQRPISANPSMSKPQKRDQIGGMLHSTATPGASAKAFADNMNSPTAGISVTFCIDETGTYQLMPLGIKGNHCGTAYTGGPSANNTHWSCEVCEPMECRFLPIEWAALYSGGASNTPYVVKRLQQELKTLGHYKMDIDGSFGPGTVAAVKAYQSSVGLAADGSVGPTTLMYLQKREGSYLRYNAALAQPFFDKVYSQTVALFAWGIKAIGGDPMTDIICHSEGYKKGIASNHADVMHWFPQHGKNMDIFRADVARKMKGDAPADPLSAAVDKLTRCGHINSPEYWKGGNYSAANVQALLIKFADAV